MTGRPPQSATTWSPALRSRLAWPSRCQARSKIAPRSSATVPGSQYQRAGSALAVPGCCAGRSMVASVRMVPLLDARALADQHHRDLRRGLAAGIGPDHVVGADGQVAHAELAGLVDMDFAREAHVAADDDRLALGRGAGDAAVGGLRGREPGEAEAGRADRDGQEHGLERGIAMLHWFPPG